MNKSLIKNNISKFALVLEMIIVFVIFGFLTDGLFVSNTNINNLFLQGCTYSIIAISMVLVMVIGGIDLSAGAVLGFLCNVAATLYINGANVYITVLVTLLAGLVIGCWNGYWIAYRSLPAFIVTLAGQLVFKGLSLLVGKGISVGPVGEDFMQFGSGYLPGVLFSIGRAGDLSLYAIILVVFVIAFSAIRKHNKEVKFGICETKMGAVIAKTAALCAAVVLIGIMLISFRGIPCALLIMGLLAVVITIVANKTPFGRSIYAIGGNTEAAKLSGINVKKNTFKVYMLHGLVVAVASIVYLGRIGQASSTTGVNFEFSAITGCIVGGTSTLGGSGTIIGAIIGAMLMVSLDNGMSLLNLGTTYQYIIKGLVLLLAVALDVSSKKINEGKV